MEIQKANGLYFEFVDLSDSIVVGWRNVSESFSVDLEVSISKHHPLYIKPPSEHRSCFKKGVLKFASVTSIEGLLPVEDVTPTKDANGEIYFDTLHGVWTTDTGYYIEGEFGEVQIESAAPTLDFDDQ